VWTDPKSNTGVIVLTNRVHPDDKGNVTQLRREIGTIVAAAVKP
jgi:CubicO group peptidase (beta-lactamase class C family)